MKQTTQERAPIPCLAIGRPPAHTGGLWASASQPCGGKLLPAVLATHCELAASARLPLSVVRLPAAADSRDLLANRRLGWAQGGNMFY